jgi:hypothetical protein
MVNREFSSDRPIVFKVDEDATEASAAESAAVRTAATAAEAMTNVRVFGRPGARRGQPLGPSATFFLPKNLK